MRIQSAEHTLQPGGLVKGRRDMAAARLLCPRLVIGTLEGVLHHARLCWLFLQDKNNVSCYLNNNVSCYLIKQTIKTPSSTQSHVLSVSYIRHVESKASPESFSLRQVRPKVTGLVKSIP